MNSKTMNCNLEVNHHHTILLITINSLITSTTCQIMSSKMLWIEAIKQIIKVMKWIIKAIKCNNWITHHHMISLVTINSFVALSIWMISKTNHNLNIKMKLYCHLASSISSKWMSHTEHISQIMHCLSITTSKISLYIMSTSLNLHITLMSSSTTLYSLLNMVIHSIHVIHVKCL